MDFAPPLYIPRLPFLFPASSFSCLLPLLSWSKLTISLWITEDSVVLSFSFSGLGLDTSPVMKSPPKLEGDATDGSFANKHGRHVIGHMDDYSALRQQIAEGKLLVKKIMSLVRSACSFPGLEAQGTEVITPVALDALFPCAPSSFDVNSFSHHFCFCFCFSCFASLNSWGFLFHVQQPGPVFSISYFHCEFCSLPDVADWIFPLSPTETHGIA